MSPAHLLEAELGGCFPRVSGDEPANEVVGLSGELFSPRERG